MIESMSGEFDTAVRKVIAKAGWSVLKSGSKDDLSDFAVETQLGAVFDFTECVIRRSEDGSEWLMRFCVTVCNLKGDDNASGAGAIEPYTSLFSWQDSAVHSMPQHSKFWVRFACLKYGSKTSNEMSITDMRQFFDEAKMLSDNVRNTIVIQYKAAIKKILSNKNMINMQNISLRTVFKIESFTASVTDEEFPWQYRKIIMGSAPFSDSIRSSVWRTLSELRNVFETKADEILPIDDLGFQRGVYLIDLNKSRAALFGVANNSLANAKSDSQASGISEIKSAPSNVIGILSGTMIAAAI